MRRWVLSALWVILVGCSAADEDASQGADAAEDAAGVTEDAEGPGSPADAAPADDTTLDQLDVTEEPEVAEPDADAALDVDPGEGDSIDEDAVQDDAGDGVSGDATGDATDGDVAIEDAGDGEVEDVASPCDDCPEGTVCKENECAEVVCEPGESVCLDPNTTAKCGPFGVDFYPAPCLPGYQCIDGACAPPQANILILFDTSSSMGFSIPGGGPSKPWPHCESPSDPQTKIGASKAAFADALGEDDLANPARFALLRFPQQTSFTPSPFCNSGYVSALGNMTGDLGDHATVLGISWFADNLGQVVVEPFGAEAGDNLDEVLEWMDFDETIEIVPDVPCPECEGMCTSGNCAIHTNPELRTAVGTPLGKSLFYAGEYIRQMVLVEGKPCTEDSDCGNVHYSCVEGECHDPAFDCRETVIVLFTDGAESTNISPTDFFNPVNQAKRFFMGLSCVSDAGCAPGATCVDGTCLPKGSGTLAEILVDPTVGVCEGGLTACTVADPVECSSGSCELPSNTFSDPQNVQTLGGWLAQPLRVRVHVIDAAVYGGESNAEMNRDTALFGGGEYVPVDAASSAELIEAIAVLTDPKPNISCF